MPWIDKDKCTGCETCVEECLVKAISIIDGTAEIDMENCIHCGTCHEVCPEDAVMHDSAKIQERINENVEKTKRFMSDCGNYLKDASEGQKCLNRMLKHFKNEKDIAEQTLKELESLKNT